MHTQSSRAPSVIHRVRCALLCLCAGAANIGCQAVQDLMAQAPKPTADIRSVELSNISLQQATLDFDVSISNPYSVALPLTDFDYRLSSDGSSLVDGEVHVNESIPAEGESTVTIPATVRFADVMSILGNVRPGSTLPYAAALTLKVDAPGVGELALPLEHDGSLPIPAPPVIDLDGITWESLSFDEATAVLRLRIGNLNDFPIDLTAIDYALSLAGSSIATTSVREAVSIAEGGEGVVEIPLTILPKDLGLAALRMLQGDGAAYELAGSIDVDTPFGSMSLPFESAGETVFD